MLSLTTFLYKTIDPVFNVGPETGSMSRVIDTKF